MNIQKNILFITQWDFKDALVQTYTLPYIRIIQNLNVFESAWLILLNGEIKEPKYSRLDKLYIVELPYENITFFSFPKIYTFLKHLVKKQNITHLHPWCTPAGSIGILLKQIHNKKLNLVIDSFEPHAEAMVENGAWKKNSLKFKTLFKFEKLQAKYADYLVFAAPGMQDYINVKYRVNIKKYMVKPACVDLELFNFDKKKNESLLNKLNLNNKTVCVYAGKFGGIYLKNEVYEFIKCCINIIGEKFRFLLLSNLSDEELNHQLLKFNIPLKYIVKQFVKHSEVADYIGLADFAICPVKPVPTKQYCSPIKNGEYWAMGLPVIITKNISCDSNLIEEHNIGYVLKELNNNEYNLAIKRILQLLSEKNLPLRIRQFAEEQRQFSIAQNTYKMIYGM